MTMEDWARYEQNILSVMEEVNHKEGERIDLVLFLNGFAIFAVELKCNTSGQNYENAINQYKRERHRVIYTSTEPPCVWLCVFY
jgi:type I site-specific restriction-modification system R (restriction) subunit